MSHITKVSRVARQGIPQVVSRAAIRTSLIVVATMAIMSPLASADDRGRGRDHAASTQSASGTRSAPAGAPARGQAAQAQPRAQAVTPPPPARSQAAQVQPRLQTITPPPSVNSDAVAPRAVPRNEAAQVQTRAQAVTPPPTVNRDAVAVPRAVPRTEGQAAPRNNGPSAPPVVHPDAGRQWQSGTARYAARPNYSAHYYGRPYYARPYYPRPYAFRPHWQLGFGIYVGYPVVYGYAYPVPVPVYGYGAPVEPVVVGPGSTSYGGVSLEFTPGEAAVFVDGTYAGTVADFDGTRQPLNLTAGTHHIELQADGYEPLSFDVTAQSGQLIPYRGDMLAAR